jgi:hypothetical protein
VTRPARATAFLVLLALAACSAGAGLPVLSSPEDVVRVERIAHPMLESLPFRFLRKTFTFHVIGDDRAAAWHVAPGIIYVSQTAARYSTDDELSQVLAHALAHDLLAHPPSETDVSDGRTAAQLAAVVAVPGGIVLGGMVDGVMGARDYTLSQEIEAERNGLRLWLWSGRSCGAWIALRQGQRDRGQSWHEPIKDIAPPFDDLLAVASEECAGTPAARR